MVDISIEKLDSLFQSYNYQVANQSNKEVRIYTLRYGMYHAAEIIKLNESIDATNEQKEYSQMGYATEVKTFSSEFEIEEYLFEGFFIKTPLGNELKRRYTRFVNKQLHNLPENSEYKYINSPYSLMLQNEQQAVIENETFNPKESINIISKINELITNISGAIFMIIEAPAGFGKTCTAYEILNNFSTEHSKKLPFFSELSRNREARIFKHILLNEIDEQFPNGIKKNIVIDQITKGRIPLIIDGFDELISRESTKEEVESMLTTIMELLNGKAKIIVTTRKTALFSSEEFFKTVDKSTKKFSIARIEIKEPAIDNWLNQDRINVIEAKNFPINYLENPVLLSYLRNIPFEKFKNYLENNSEESIVTKYIDYLLKREQERQNIKLAPLEQLKIFRNLVQFMTEYNVTSESKEMIKDFIRDYNYDIIKKSLDNYLPEHRPSLEDLIETLANHVFLDRKQNGKIGIVNDFILGILVADSLILGEYQQNYTNYNEIIPQDFASRAVQAYKIQKDDKKIGLWKTFNNECCVFNYDLIFFFHLDYFFVKKFNKVYNNLVIDGWKLQDVKFNKDAQFNQSVYSNVTFDNCFFDLNSFNNCSFYNCTFQYCSIVPVPCEKTYNDFGIFACHDNNGFINKIAERIISSKNHIAVLTDYEILKVFFQSKKDKPVPRKISFLKSNLSSFSLQQINEKVSGLKQNLHIYFKDDNCFVTQKGVKYYNELKDSIS